MNTTNHLGVSEEALEWLKKVNRSNDAIGDVDWFKSNAQGYCFAWIGGSKSLFVAGIEGSRHYEVPVPGGYVVIPNDAPEGARKFLDAVDTLDA